MAITVNLYYIGKNGSALKFVQEMKNLGIVDGIRKEVGNIRYDYFQSLDDPEKILLIDSWEDQTAIDAHHQSHFMKELAKLREKYDLHMEVERYQQIKNNAKDKKYIRK
ncbi:putative quinol monooxygenase [Lactobacillus mulieris]|jgi:antibiotic biosynthesis monooxygenase|uniref:Antibiotic biosynthesis monooxygenase n=2 Tax=Lactobacillus mulieris TaxID=2508708 RepID=A0AAP3GV66_9LACO|nr:MULTISPECIES: putative quinol monooxygenase [Lactobacillus]EEU21701.1 hypothetical protein HMPREF0525_00635 [Lactobacillus jensenii 27-2-CHN]EEX24569.1 antibiotic biosynthesis monooxygenase [Lactobacillus jensenii 115-3-CHN]EFH29690.1 antibiotic biosynthesis monooxygenase [Lactobacillus jensenii JV-V16]KAA9244193.1 antibiotic biosynthesis monooxygenase [Lactobacillus jensenii]KAA9369934.1 antibiotic biosynthesis monooxygenase [Lactobacillus jensenii]